MCPGVSNLLTLQSYIVIYKCAKFMHSYADTFLSTWCELEPPWKRDLSGRIASIRLGISVGQFVMTVWFGRAQPTVSGTTPGKVLWFYFNNDQTPLPADHETNFFVYPQAAKRFLLEIVKILFSVRITFPVVAPKDWNLSKSNIVVGISFLQLLLVLIFLSSSYDSQVFLK